MVPWNDSGVLIEHFAGKFPTWLSPTQVHILTISEKHKQYAADVAQQLKDHGVRVKVDDGDDTIGKKIRTHRKMRPAYMMILGDGEMNNKCVSLRSRTGAQISDLPVNEFITSLMEEIENRMAEPGLVPEPSEN